MMDTKIRRLVALFTAISVAGIAFVGFQYLQAETLFGLGPYVVKAQFTNYGGIFPKADVSYRGVEIGKTGTMRVTPTGTEVELEIDRDTPQVPASALAVVADRSAVGEQYIDLEPPADGGPYLHDGSMIPPQNTRTPVMVDQLLSNLNGLVKSVPIPELQQTVDDLYQTFNRTGPQLQRLIDASNPLVRDALAHLPQTVQLLKNGEIVLQTQADKGPQLLSFSRDLRLFSDQLKRDDPNLRNLVAQAPPAAHELEGLIRDVGPDLSHVLSNLLVVTNIVQPRLAGVEEFLVTYPLLAAAAPSVVPGDGYVHFGLVLNINDPPPCRAGYKPVGQWRPATITDKNAPFDTRTRCRESSPINVRGAQNAPQTNGLPGGGDPIGPGISDGGGYPGSPGSPGSGGAATVPQNQPAEYDAVTPDPGRPTPMLPGMTQ